MPFSSGALASPTSGSGRAALRAKERGGRGCKVAWIEVQPIFERQGVIAGFVLGLGIGLVPSITKGVLFAQGVMYRPAEAPVLPAAPDDQQSWLFWNSWAGFYWQPTATPLLDTDAQLGWVRCAGGAVTHTCAQKVLVGDVAAGGSTGHVSEVGPRKPPESERVLESPLVRDFIIEGLDATPDGSFDMTTEAGVAFISGRSRMVSETTYAYPPNANVFDEVTPEGGIEHVDYGTPYPPAVPPAGRMRLRLVQTGGSGIIGAIDLRQREPITKTISEASLHWRKIFTELRITAGPYAGAYRWAANNGIVWYFSSLGLFHVVQYFPVEVKAYLNAYMAHLRADYSIQDVNADLATPKAEDSHDSYAATFLLLLERYVRVTGDWAYLDEASPFPHDSITVLECAIRIGHYNIAAQIKTEAWCLANGFPVNQPNGHNTLLVSPFQNGRRLNPDGSTFVYDYGLLMDNTECFRALLDFGQLLVEVGDPNGETWIAHAKNIGNAIHGLYDVSRNLWSYHDGVGEGGIEWYGPLAWRAWGNVNGTAWYPDLMAAVWPELHGTFTTIGGEQTETTIITDATRFNFGWERMCNLAPNWWNSRAYDAFPQMQVALLAAKRKEFTKAAAMLDRVARYFLVPGAPTTGLTHLAEVGPAVGVQNLLLTPLASEDPLVAYPRTTLRFRKSVTDLHIGSPSRVQIVDALKVIACDAEVKRVSTTANTTVAAPQIAAGEQGQILRLHNAGDTYSIILQDGSGLKLATPALTLFPGAFTDFVFLGSVWVQASQPAKFSRLDLQQVVDGHSGASIENDINRLNISGGLCSGPSAGDLQGRNIVRLLDTLLVDMGCIGTEAPYVDGAALAVLTVLGLAYLNGTAVIGGGAKGAAGEKLTVNGNTLLNGLLEIISTVKLTGNVADTILTLNTDKQVIGQTYPNARLLLDVYAKGEVYSKAQIDTILANYATLNYVDNELLGKADANHTHNFSVYSGLAGDPAHQHLVSGTTGIEN